MISSTLINELHPGQWLSAQDACAFLGIKRATLYAYVSRGKVRAQPGDGGRRRVYLREDLMRLRAGRGAGGVSGRSNLGRIDTELTSVTSSGPHYRGHSALALAADARWPFESTCELLWGVDSDLDVLLERPAWPRATDGRSINRTPATNTLDSMAGVVLQGVADVQRHDLGAEADLRKSRHLVRLALAGANLPRDPSAAEWALAQPSLAGGFLAAFGQQPRGESTRVVDATLTLLADPGLDGAAVAARAAVAGGAEVYRALTAGLCALTLNGLAPHLALKPIVALHAEVGAPEHASRRLRERIARREPVPGFAGAFDARAHALLALANELGGGKGSLRVFRALVDGAELAGLAPPNLALSLFAVAEALGVGPDGAVALLALGRCAGLIAHALEQRAEGPLPFAPRYLGPPLRDPDGLP